MSLFVLGSSEVVAAFALGGMEGVSTSGPGEILAALEDLAGRPEPVEVLVIEEEAAESVREEVERLKLSPGGPLIVEVAGFGGPRERRKSPLQLVQEALGIRI